MMEAKLPVVELNKAEAARQREEKQEAARQKAAEKLRKQGNAVFDANQNPKYAAFPSMQENQLMKIFHNYYQVLQRLIQGH